MSRTLHRIPKRYKKGRPLWWNQCDREVGSSGGFAPRPPRFNASVPVRKLWKGKTGSVGDPASVPAPESALGLLLSRALSSAQAKRIVAKEEEGKQREQVRQTARFRAIIRAKMRTTVQRCNVEPRRERPQ